MHNEMLKQCSVDLKIQTAGVTLTFYLSSRQWVLHCYTLSTKFENSMTLRSGIRSPSVTDRRTDSAAVPLLARATYNYEYKTIYLILYNISSNLYIVRQ